MLSRSPNGWADLIKRKYVLGGLFIFVVALDVAFSLILISEFSSFFSFYYIPTTSMEPAIPHSSIVIVANDPSLARIGDVVVYRYSPLQPPLVHRLIDVENNGQIAIIKGDNAPFVDRVPFERIEGVVVLSIPYGGIVRFAFVNYPSLFGALLSSALSMIIVSILMHTADKSKNK